MKKIIDLSKTKEVYKGKTTIIMKKELLDTIDLSNLGKLYCQNMQLEKDNSKNKFLLDLLDDLSDEQKEQIRQRVSSSSRSQHIEEYMEFFRDEKIYKWGDELYSLNDLKNIGKDFMMFMIMQYLDYEECELLKFADADEVDNIMDINDDDNNDKLREYIEKKGKDMIFELNIDDWMESEGMEQIDEAISQLEKVGSDLAQYIEIVKLNYDICDEVEKKLASKVEKYIEYISVDTATSLVYEMYCE